MHLSVTEEPSTSRRATESAALIDLASTARPRNILLYGIRLHQPEVRALSFHTSLFFFRFVSLGSLRLPEECTFRERPNKTRWETSFKVFCSNVLASGKVAVFIVCMSKVLLATFCVQVGKDVGQSVWFKEQDISVLPFRRCTSELKAREIKRTERCFRCKASCWPRHFVWTLCHGNPLRSQPNLHRDH